ncbi:hypothetical protein Hanom_Chr17g01581641 [Helianthus anomalus]
MSIGPSPLKTLIIKIQHSLKTLILSFVCSTDTPLFSASSFTWRKPNIILIPILPLHTHHTTIRPPSLSLDDNLAATGGAGCRSWYSGHTHHTTLLHTYTSLPHLDILKNEERR